MKSIQARIQRWLGAVDYPGEILTGVPVVEIKGDAEAAVIHHHGVLAYDTRLVRIASVLGPVTIFGSDLRVYRMNRERIVLQGKVHSVQIGETAP